MTRAICPACRAPIALDAALCGRCGLAVRPTCANCGEALVGGDVACRRCREPIDSTSLTTPRSVRAVYAAPTPRAVAVAPRTDAGRIEEGHVVEAAAPVRRKRRRGAVFVQLLVIAVVAGLLVAGGLLALEAFAPRPSAPFDLVHRSFPAMGFSISRPSTWTESTRRVAGNAAVVFTEPGDTQRGFRVIAEATTLTKARALSASEARHPAKGAHPIGMTDSLTVDANRAFRYTFTEGGTFTQQWWIERPGGVFLVELWAPDSDEQGSAQLADRIVETFGVG